MTSATGENAGGRRKRGLRSRLPMAGVVLACVTAVVVAVSGAATSVPGLQFLPPGHWVFNAALSSVFHVDGATASVDARAEVPGAAGSLVVQGDSSGYVVGDSRITEFGKSSLEVEDSFEAPSDELPVGVEIAGGPYLVYPEAGQVVRLGGKARTMTVGGPIGAPVSTSDGTVWLPRVNAGLLCRVAADEDVVSCPVALPEGHSGAMTVVDDRPMFVDTTSDAMHLVEHDELGDAHALGVDVADDARLASTDAAGRVVVLDQQAHKLHLVDTAQDGVEPVSIELAAGEYDGPVANGSVIAVVDRESSTLATFDLDGTEREKTPIPKESGDPRLTRGEDDRLYVDGAEGEHVLVVDRDGSVDEVPVREEENTPSATEADEDRDNDREVTPPSASEPPQSTQPPVSPPQEAPRPPVNPAPDKPDPGTPEVPASPPGAPVGVQASSGDASAAVSWGAAPDNRAPITGYTISWPGGSTTAAPTARSTTIPGLANGTSYVFTVSATNSAGTGPGASSNPVTPVAPIRPASEPTSLVGSYDRGAQQATLTWAAPADPGGGQVLHYVATAMGVQQQTVTGTSATFEPIETDGSVSLSVYAVTQTPDGQQLTGATATTTADGGTGTPAITLSRGAATEEHCGQDDACAWMHVVASGLEPGTTYTFMPHSTAPGYNNGGHSTPAQDDGSITIDQFAYSGVGHTVWVTVTLSDGTELKSNEMVWEAG